MAKGDFVPSTYKSKYVNEKRKEYMAQPNVIEFNKALRHKAFKIGRPYAFKDVETLANDINGYFETCEKTTTIPTITSLALWLGCDAETIYNHANNSSSPFFGLLKNAITYCHTTLESGAIENKVNPAVYIFTAKNRFNMSDDQTITLKGSDNQPNNAETINAIKEQIASENANETLIEYHEKD